MSNDRYEKIRKALAMGPTPGPWEVIYGIEVFTPLGARNASGAKAAANDGWHVADCDTGVTYTEEGKEEIPYEEKKANASLIAACDPDTIRELLTERDALGAENARLREAMLDERDALLDECDALVAENARLRQALEGLYFIVATLRERLDEGAKP